MVARLKPAVLAIALAVLAACGDGETGDIDPQPAPVSPPPVAEAPLPMPVQPAFPGAGPGMTPRAPGDLPAAGVAALPRDQDAVPDANGNYVGIAEVVEGDVIRLGRTRILLYGIDTVEPPQLCEIAGRPWECWAATVRALQTIVGEGPVTCMPAGPADMFGRILALCTVNGESVNARMVRGGFALVWEDEMPEYLPLEDAARQERVGLWQGTFERPEVFRENTGQTLRRP